MLQALVATAAHVTSVNNHFSHNYYIAAGVFAAIALGAVVYIASLIYRRINLDDYGNKITYTVCIFMLCAAVSGVLLIDDPGTTYTIYGNVVSAGYDGEVYEHFINIDGTRIYHDDYDENRRLLNKYVKMTCDTQTTGDSVSSKDNICSVAEMSDTKITPDSKGGSN